MKKEYLPLSGVLASSVLVDWFDGLLVTHELSGDTALTGPVSTVCDQAALYGLLNRLGDLGLALICRAP